MEIGQRIKARRESIGMSQVALGDKIGEKKQTIYKYESGKITNIPIDKIAAMAKAMQTTPAYLMGWENNEKVLTPDAEGEPDALTQRLNELLALANEDTKRAMIVLLEQSQNQ